MKEAAIGMHFEGKQVAGRAVGTIPGSVIGGVMVCVVAVAQRTGHSSRGQMSQLRLRLL